jgi:hypothetical protein
MFDNFIAKRKDHECFHVHDKRYISDVKAVSKMGIRGLQDLVAEQDKYISSLVDKVIQIIYRFTTQKNYTIRLSIRINSFKRNTK